LNLLKDEEAYQNILQRFRIIYSRMRILSFRTAKDFKGREALRIYLNQATSYALL
jgi:hypothetical protein